MAFFKEQKRIEFMQGNFETVFVVEKKTLNTNQLFSLIDDVIFINLLIPNVFYFDCELATVDFLLS